jgi:hypothetical protein
MKIDRGFRLGKFGRVKIDFDGEDESSKAQLGFNGTDESKLSADITEVAE